ncbi:MAG: beta galactosidase jelly roll domain-containing protein [Planctomycetota bacterium]
MCKTTGAALGVLALAGGLVAGAAETTQPGQSQLLSEGWQLKSSVLVAEDGARISTAGYEPQGWLKTAVPSTVLSALVKNGVYPDPRKGLDCYRIPDSSDEFNRKYDLAKFSYLPEQRNPWRDPYWYRTEFNLPPAQDGQRVWLNLNCINYRADVWLNGAQVGEAKSVAGMFQRFRFDVTAHARPGPNALAVRIHPVDHPGTPDTQLAVFGPHRGEHKEIERDVTEIETTGYDCMMTVPDRNMGILQEVFVDRTGAVDIRHPFVATELPLPDTSRATLAVSAELVNASAAPVRGVLRGVVAGTFDAGGTPAVRIAGVSPAPAGGTPALPAVRFEQPVELGPNETRLVRVEPKPVLPQPRLWWPVNYGAQPLYDLTLQFAADGAVSAEQTVRFGVRQVTTELHQLDGCHGRRVLVNGQKIFCRGGYIQPELLLDWDARRIENEIRYFADANMNLIYFEDIPNPPDAFLDACDRHGVLFGNCFYSCDWAKVRGRPEDLALLEACTVDVLKRYRNHPSLVLYMAMNEGYTCAEVYTMWRRHVVALDGTRFWIPSAYFPDSLKNPAAHFKDDLPTGMNDLGNKSYGWQEPATYFRWVREDRSWMFKMESGSASLPPISSLAKFLPDLGARAKDAPFPLTETWAHHGANDYYKPYDQAIRRLHGEPESVTDYCWKGHLLTADQHRAFYEAVNHRMWDITSGFTEWKINSCFPDVQWQNFDYYLKPGVSHFFIKRACEPLHVQLDQLDQQVSVINCRLEPQPDLEVTARVFGPKAEPLWQRTAKLSVPANAHAEAFAIANLAALAPFVFVKLELKDAAGRVVSENFYWLRGQGTRDCTALQQLPLVKLDTASKIEDSGAEKLVQASVTNPSTHVAFFIQLALTKGARGEEILPVFWDDNYFSLLPGETRQVAARIAMRNLGGEQPVLEAGGWNIAGDYRCTDLKPAQATVKAGEAFTLTATISDTFLDGSRVPLLVDGQPAGAKWAWARGGKSDEVQFKLNLAQPGTHRLTVGQSEAKVNVE